jgi:hypothetical protein
VRAGYSSRTAGRCKSGTTDPPQKSPDAAPPPRPSPLTPEEKAHRLAALRAALAGAAPAFQARLRRGREVERP